MQIIMWYFNWAFKKHILYDFPNPGKESVLKPIELFFPRDWMAKETLRIDSGEANPVTWTDPFIPWCGRIKRCDGVTFVYYNLVIVSRIQVEAAAITTLQSEEELS